MQSEPANHGYQHEPDAILPLQPKSLALHAVAQQVLAFGSGDFIHPDFLETCRAADGGDVAGNADLLPGWLGGGAGGK